MTKIKSNDKKYKNKEWLKEQYIEKNKDGNEIAKNFDVTPETIYYWTKKFDLNKKESTSQNYYKVVDGKLECSKCGEIKKVEKFDKDQSNPTGYSYMCKDCKSDYMSSYMKEWRENNRQKYLRALKEWRENNKKKRRRYYRQWENEKRNNDPKYKLEDNFSGSIRRAISKNKNGRHWESLVPYNLEDLKEHLEEQFEDGMTWDNYGDWHIDHITPRSNFDYENPEDEEFQACWALDNLQPLWAKDNISKNDSLDWQK